VYQWLFFSQYQVLKNNCDNPLTAESSSGKKQKNWVLKYSQVYGIAKNEMPTLAIVTRFKKIERPNIFLHAKQW